MNENVSKFLVSTACPAQRRRVVHRETARCAGQGASVHRSSTGNRGLYTDPVHDGLGFQPAFIKGSYNQRISTEWRTEMALPWVRLDANIASHDKIVELVGERDGYRAAWVYVCAIGWSGGQGTDGVIPKAVLPLIHGNERIAQMLVNHRLWEYGEDAKHYIIRNWSERQQLNNVSVSMRSSMREGGRRGACMRWHEPGCTCWQTA
jgi:hypothetical protein